MKNRSPDLLRDYCDAFVRWAKGIADHEYVEKLYARGLITMDESVKMLRKMAQEQTIKEDVV